MPHARSRAVLWAAALAWLAAGAATVQAAEALVPAAARPPPPAVACTLVAVGKVLIEADGQPLSLPDTHPDCARLNIRRGKVLACQADRAGRPVCREFSATKPIRREAFATGSDNRVLAALMDMLGGQRGTAAAISRGAAGLLPSGTVLALRPRWAPPFDHPEFSGVQRVAILQGSASGPQVASVARGAAARGIDLSVLPPGATYWAAAVGGGPAPSAFQRAGATERGLALAELARINRDHRASPAARALMRATWLAEQHYRFDAQAELQAAGIAAPD